MATAYFAHETAVVDPRARIGSGTQVWHFSHVSDGARIGRECKLGQNVYVAPTAVLGDRVKVQNNVSIYDGVEIEDEVFLGPSCVLTNVSNPRSQVNRKAAYEKTLLRCGASVGANATIVCGVTLGRYSFIAAGAVVTKSVPDYALMVGVPACQSGWISRHGVPLNSPDADGIYTCPESRLRYREDNGVLRCLDLDEDEPLPDHLTQSSASYRSFKDSLQPSSLASGT